MFRYNRYTTHGFTNEASPFSFKEAIALDVYDISLSRCLRWELFKQYTGSLGINPRLVPTADQLRYLKTRGLTSSKYLKALLLSTTMVCRDRLEVVIRLFAFLLKQNPLLNISTPEEHQHCDFTDNYTAHSAMHYLDFLYTHYFSKGNNVPGENGYPKLTSVYGQTDNGDF